ncbi:hypothetical protein COOONC_13483 [Cooperia oncophora]
MMAYVRPNYQNIVLAPETTTRCSKPKGASPVPYGGNMNIRAPAENKMRGTYDPNYQTLAGLNNDDVFKPKVRDYPSETHFRLCSFEGALQLETFEF